MSRTSFFSYPFPINIEEWELSPNQEADTIEINGRRVAKIINRESEGRVREDLRTHWAKEGADSYKRFSN